MFFRPNNFEEPLEDRNQNSECSLGTFKRAQSISSNQNQEKKLSINKQIKENLLKFEMESL